MAPDGKYLTHIPPDKPPKRMVETIRQHMAYPRALDNRKTIPMILRLAVIVFASTLSALSNAPWAGARVYESGPLIVSHPWARASAPTARNGAAYLKIEAGSGAKDRLVGARSPVAETVEVHETTVTDGIARMRRVPGVGIASDQPVDLAPGGMHIMLMGLKSPLKEGDSFPLVLTFEKAGDLTVEVVVEAPGAMGPHGMAGTSKPEHQHGASPNPHHESPAHKH